MQINTVTRTVLFIRQCFIISVLALTAFHSAHAQETPSGQPSQAIVLATVNIYNATSTQNGNEFSISFDLTNRVGVQPGVKYSVVLVQETAVGQTVMDEHVYDETLNLGENSSEHRTVTYTAPAHLDGAYTLFLTSENTSGFPFGQALLGKVTLEKRAGQDGILALDTASCYLTVQGEKDQPQYNPLQGVDIAATENLQSNCIVENTSDGAVTATPLFVTRARSSFGEVVTAEGGDSTPVTFAPKEKRMVTTTLPKPIGAQAYNVNLKYGAASNEIAYHYVIQGGSGTIQNMLLDKDTYAAGETARVSFMWSPAADGFTGSRQGAGTKLQDPSFAIVLVDEFGATCAEPYTQTLRTNDVLVQATIPITGTCVHPEAKVTLTDSVLGTLAEASFETATVTPVVTETSVAPETASDSNMRMVAGLLVLLAILSVIFFRNRTLVAPLVLLFAIGVMFGGAERVQADTFYINWMVTDSCTEGGGCTYRAENGAVVTVSLNKASYTPSETMTVSGSVKSLMCSNGSIQFSLTYAIDSAAAQYLINQNIGGGSTAYATAYPSAPATVGNHNANFFGKMYSFSDDGSSYSIPFTVTDPAPIGSADSASCNTVVGWTCDPSAWSQALSVHIYEGGAFVGAATANIFREAAVGSVCGNGTSAHGYEFAIPASYKNNATHNFTPYAIGINSGGSANGNNPALGTVVMPACAPAVNGSCGASNNSCTAGSLSDTADNATNYLWSCNGTGGGANASCSLLKPPTTPTGLTATPAACGTGQINLAWNAVAGATSYTLRDGVSVIYSGASASFAHTGLAAGSSHSYTVSANNGAGSSAYSGAVGGNAPVVCAVVPSTPANFTATAGSCGTGRIDLAWAASAGATGYDVQIDGGAWVNQNNVLSYAHTGLVAGSSHTYAVRAWNAVGAGAGSATLTRTAPAVCTGIAEPTNQSYSCNAAGTQVTLSWSAVTGATAYPLRVADTLAGCSDATLQGSTGNDGCISPTEYIRGNPGANTAVSQTVSVQPGKAYQWWVHAYDGTAWSPYTQHSFTCTAPVISAINLTSSGLTVPASVTVNAALNFSATVSNIGNTTTGIGFNDNFSYSTSATGPWTNLPNIAKAALVSGGTSNDSGAYTPTVTGTLYIQHCVDSTNVIAEGANETPNCTVSGGVSVNAAVANTPPSVNAGPDRLITLPTASVTVGGASATDSDGIASRVWSYRTGPGIFPTIAGGTTLTPTVSGMIVPGTYVFRLTATDSLGASASDDMQVFVSSAPECNDGVDNDGDGQIDYPADLGCSSLIDDSEAGGAPTLTASPLTVNVGGDTTLTWNLNGQTGCTITGGSPSTYTPATQTGTFSRTINARTTFTLSCTSGGGSDSVTVEIAPMGFET